MQHCKVVRIAVAILCLGLGACATVPEEAVTLSGSVGEDLEQFHQGYRETIRLSFNQMRERGLTIIDEVWVPAYLESLQPVSSNKVLCLVISADSMAVVNRWNSS